MIRLAICQQIIPRYRAPVFDLLGAQPDVDLTVLADRVEPRLPGADPPRFRHEPSHQRRPRWLPNAFIYQQGEIDAIDPSRFDLVMMTWNTRHLSVPPALQRARRLGVPVVLWGHGYSKRPAWVRDWLRNALGRRADAVLLYTRTVADHLVSAAGFDRDRVFVAQNAIDQTPIQAARLDWAAQPERLEAFRAEHRIDPAETVVFLSRLLAENRAGLLVEALAALHRVRPRATLVIIGEGPARGEIEALATRLGVRDRLLLPGAIFDDRELAPWMMSATLFCYPVNIGLSILHAFGYGLPVVTSDDPVSHGPEIESLRPGANGLLFRDGDAADMVSQWSRLMDDPGWREQLGRAALETVEHDYTLERMVQGFLDAMTVVDGRQRRVEPIRSAGS